LSLQIKKRMPLHKDPIFETLSRAQNSMYH
jgi:hypothetical protein